MLAMSQLHTLFWCISGEKHCVGRLLGLHCVKVLLLLLLLLLLLASITSPVLRVRDLLCPHGRHPSSKC
jgi:hypothetical protein